MPGYYYEMGFDPKMNSKMNILAGIRNYPKMERRTFYVPQWSS